MDARSPEEQLEILLSGSAEVISRQELLEKLKTARKEERPLLVKLGMDPSAPDIHLGHTVVLRKLRQFQDLGHKVQFLIGDFTAMIGDPTGKTVTRPPLTREEVDANAKTYLEQVFRVLDRDPERIQIYRNSEWCRPMSFEEVIRLAARSTVARILERDDFTLRLKDGKPVGLHELLYPLIQGYDSVVMKSDVEMCGTDQKFNCLVARSLQQEAGQAPEAILAMPLLVGLDGVKKMSKSLGNYVGVTEAPNDMFAKLMSVSDGLMWDYYAILSDDPQWAAKKEKVARGDYHPRQAKVDLALEITARFHDAEKADSARKYFESRRQFTSDVDYKRVEVKAGARKAADLLVSAGVASSKSEAKRLIEQGAMFWGPEGREPQRVVSFGEQVLLEKGNTGILKCGKVFLRITAKE
ncbi:MAG: tyrosine--tRNA ligase [Deltaproteobacteria bacterium]|nr:tyrosine--tRNA ligase [Deltaproteobacteria bacterium]